jgi:hypothetical protein
MKKKRIITLLIILPFLFLSFLRPVAAQEDSGGILKGGCTLGVGISEDCKIDLLAGHRAIYNMGKRVTNEAGEEIQKLMYKMMYSLLANTVTEFAPEAVVLHADASLGDIDVPEHMKYGLSGIVDRQVTTALNSYPSVDVVGHLAMEWVPGYKDNQTIYASGYKDLQSSKVDVLWSETRNIAYLGFVVIMIVIGFMIMFRSKIGGQVVVTIGNSIPKIVVALILVTFSFAIVGLVIDLGGVLMGIIANILKLKEEFVTPWNIIQLLRGTVGFTDEIYTGIGIVDIALNFAAAIFGYGTDIGIGTEGAPFGGLFFLLTFIMILGFVTFAAIKLWFTLIKSYLIILANTVIAPISIMAGSLPGNQHITINWFKAVVRNVLVFPVAFAIINIPQYLARQGAVFSFPETFGYKDSPPIFLPDSYFPNLMLVAIKILAIFVAAQTPKLLASVIPPTGSKSGSDAGAAIKQSLSKVPLVGGMFKG